MITAKSTPEEVLGELKEGYAKAKYWHVKHYGGEKKCQEKVNELCKNNKDVSTGDSGVEDSLNEYEKKIEEFDNGYLQGETDKRK